MRAPELELKTILHSLHMQRPATWQDNEPLQNWEGVKVDRDGFVERLDLSSLQNLSFDICELGSIIGPRLKSLNVTDQRNVTGDIVALSAAPNFEELRALRTNLYGDISVLQNCPDLLILDCQETSIHGSISVFQYCPEASYFRYFGSRIQLPPNCPTGEDFGSPWPDQYRSKEAMDGLRDWLNSRRIEAHDN